MSEVNSYILKNPREIRELNLLFSLYRKYDGIGEIPMNKLLSLPNPMINATIIERIGKTIKFPKEIYFKIHSEFSKEPDFIFYIINMAVLIIEENLKVNNKNKKPQLTTQMIDLISELLFRFYDFENAFNVISLNDKSDFIEIRLKEPLYSNL